MELTTLCSTCRFQDRSCFSCLWLLIPILLTSDVDPDPDQYVSDLPDPDPSLFVWIRILPLSSKRVKKPWCLLFWLTFFYLTSSKASGFFLLSVPVKGRFLIHAEGGAGDNSSPSKIFQVTDDMEEGLAVIAGRRPKILINGHPFKTFPTTSWSFNPKIDITGRTWVRISVWQLPA